VRRAREGPGVARGDAELLASLFPDPRYVLLTRRDTISQTISFWRALASGVWWQMEGTRPAIQEQRPPSLEEIEALQAALAEQERSWRHLFEANHIQPLEVVYEDFVEDYVGTVEAVLDHARIEHAALTLPPPRLVSQSDALAREMLGSGRRLVLDGDGGR
jgi:LPS sulfotransferase NodH